VQSLAWLLALFAALYGLYVLYFFLMQRTILFPTHLLPPSPAIPAPLAGREILWVTVDGEAVEAWLLWPQAHEPDLTASVPLVVVGHGNGERIDEWGRAVEPLRGMGYAVLLVEYPGYGRSGGKPSQQSILTTFQMAYDAVVARPQIDGERVIFFGRSVGGAAVALLSQTRPSAGMILFSTFTSVGEMAQGMGLPGFLARDPFDVRAAVSAYPGPLLILHGERDRIVPFRHGQALHQAAAHSHFLPLACDHNDCVQDWRAFWQRLRPFLDDAAALGEP
jgi:pimeloyl-ACP methyl ester carboxylesterase